MIHKRGKKMFLPTVKVSLFLQWKCIEYKLKSTSNKACVDRTENIQNIITNITINSYAQMQRARMQTDKCVFFKNMFAIWGDQRNQEREKRNYIRIKVTISYELKYIWILYSIFCCNSASTKINWSLLCSIHILLLILNIFNITFICFMCACFRMHNVSNWKTSSNRQKPFLTLCIYSCSSIFWHKRTAQSLWLIQ